MKDMTRSRRRLATSRDCSFIVWAIRVAVRNLICCPLSGSTARNKSKSVRSADARTRASKRSSFAPATENRSRKRSDCFGLIVKTLKPRATSASTSTRRRVSIAMKTSFDDAQAISATRVSKSPLSLGMLRSLMMWPFVSVNVPAGLKPSSTARVDGKRPGRDVEADAEIAPMCGHRGLGRAIFGRWRVCQAASRSKSSCRFGSRAGRCPRGPWASRGGRRSSPPRLVAR